MLAEVYEKFKLILLHAFFLQCLFWGASHSYVALRAGNIELVVIGYIASLVVIKTGIGRKKVKKLSSVGGRN